MNLSGKRRSKNVRVADWRNSSNIGPDEVFYNPVVGRNTPKKPDISTGALYHGGILLMKDMKSRLRKAGILSAPPENRLYEKFGLTKPTAPKYDDEISRGIREAAGDPETQKLYADRAKWRLRSRDANEQRPGEGPRSFEQRDGKLTPRPKTFGH
jgi:hypothetical protein